MQQGSYGRTSHPTHTILMTHICATHRPEQSSTAAVDVDQQLSHCHSPISPHHHTPPGPCSHSCFHNLPHWRTQVCGVRPHGARDQGPGDQGTVAVRGGCTDQQPHGGVGVVLAGRHVGVRLLPAARQELVLHRWVAVFGRGGEERQGMGLNCCEQRAENLHCIGEGWGRNGGGKGRGQKRRGGLLVADGWNLLSATIQAVCTAGGVRRVARACGP